MVFNANYNNISVISWRSVSLVEEPEYSENTTEMSQVIDKMTIVRRTEHCVYAETAMDTTTRNSDT